MSKDEYSQKIVRKLFLSEWHVIVFFFGCGAFFFVAPWFASAVNLEFVTAAALGVSFGVLIICYFTFFKRLLDFTVLRMAGLISTIWLYVSVIFAVFNEYSITEISRYQSVQIQSAEMNNRNRTGSAPTCSLKVVPGKLAE